MLVSADASGSATTDIDTVFSQPCCSPLHFVFRSISAKFTTARLGNCCGKANIPVLGNANLVQTRFATFELLKQRLLKNNRDFRAAAACSRPPCFFLRQIHPVEQKERQRERSERARERERGWARASVLCRDTGSLLFDQFTCGSMFLIKGLLFLKDSSHLTEDLPAQF